MRYYTNKFACKIADMAFGSLPAVLVREESSCPLVDDDTLAAFKADFLDIINQYEEDALLRENSTGLVQFCHDAKKYLIEDIEPVPDVNSPCVFDMSGPYEFFRSYAHHWFELLVDSVENDECFTDDDRFRACQMIVDTLCLDTFEAVFKRKFVNYIFCRILYMYASEDSFLFHPDAAKEVAVALLNHDPEEVYGLIARLQLARHEKIPFKRQKWMKDAFEVIEHNQESESEYQQWLGSLLAILLFLDNENRALLSTEQKEIIDCIMRDYLSVMTVDVYQSERYSDAFSGIEPISPDYYEKYTSCVLLDRLIPVERSHYRRAASGVLSTNDFVRCIQFTYVYSVMMLEGPLRAYSLKGFLECWPYDNDDLGYLNRSSHLLYSIVQEYGKIRYTQSPEHEALAEKAQIGTKLDAINNQLGSMQGALNIILSKVNSVSDFGNRLEEVISSAFKAEVERLESSIHASEGVSRLNTLEDYLISQVGMCWNKTLSFTKKAILTAMYYLGTMPEDEFFDARGITLCASVALEQELDAVFHRAWYSYLESNYPDPSQLVYWPFKWREYDSNHEPVGYRAFEDTEFTLGTMPYLFGWSKREGEYCPKYRGDSIPIEDFLMSQFDVDEPFDWFTAEGGILDEIDDIRIRFRNPAAHGDPITGEDARNCMKCILGISSDDDNIDTDALLWRILDVEK